MSERPIILSPAARPRALQIVGEKPTVLADDSVTNGYEVFLQEGPAGSGPPPHHHTWDEAFFTGVDAALPKGEMDVAVIGRVASQHDLTIDV